MRICHVIDYFHTDVGYQEYYLALEQARAGHSVQVISSTFRQHTVAVAGPDEALGAAQLDAAGVSVLRLEGRQLGHDRAWLRGLSGAIRTAAPDAVHVHGPFAPTTVRAVRAAADAGATVLVDNHLHEQIAPGASSPRNRAIYRSYAATVGPMLRRRVHHWAANGPYEAEFLASRLGLAGDRVELIPLGFDPEVFGWDPRRRERARHEMGADASTTIIAITGKLHPGKRPELTAAAAERLALRRPVQLALAGSIETGTRDAVERSAPTLHRQGRVLDMGLLGREELSDLYHASDAVVFARLPSISIYEAAGTGCDVLVGQDAFADWLAAQCRTVRSVPVGTDVLADVGPADDEQRAARAAAAGAAFAWSAVAERFVARYQDGPGGRRTGAGR